MVSELKERAFTGKRKEIILWALVVGWMVIIFCFSAQSGEESKELSGNITEIVVNIVVQDYDELAPDRQLAISNLASFAVRKLAHFTEYCVLGALLWNLTTLYFDSGLKRILVSWVSGSLYALTDEFHQMFSDGRTPKLMDVGIDSAGVIFGVMLAIGLFLIFERIAKKGRAQAKIID